jgi:tetratricopeptide (TPR) repeat protein/transcriptional regulator with XRE-family HTH domain
MDKMEIEDLNGIRSFGEWVQRRRKTLDLSRAGLAQKVGCAVVTIKKIEQDERRPSQQMAQLLAEHLAIPKALRRDFMRMARGKPVASNRISEEGLRLPDFLREDFQPPVRNETRFVARQRELARLETCLEKALKGNGMPVFILGEAGSGKTTLMAEFARRALEISPNLIVAGGQCNAQAGTGDPYRPFRDTLGMLTGDLETSWLAGGLTREQALRLWAGIPDTIQAITEHGPNLVDIFLPTTQVVRRLAAYLPAQADWLDQFQSLTQPDEIRSPNLDQDQVLEQVTRLLRAVSARHPLLLLLDDLQWIDDASLNLLFHLGRRLAGSRILILGACRPSELALELPADRPGLSEAHPLGLLIQEFVRLYGDVQINLDQGSLSEGRAFVDALLDSEPNQLDETFREKLFRHTQGQALFTVEVLRNMQDSSNLIKDESGSWIENPSSVPYPLPARVEAVIAQRLSRLDEPLRELLSVASVEGETFTAEVLAGILKLDLRVVLHRLSRDLDQRYRLVQEQTGGQTDTLPLNRFRFHHALFQEYLYDRLGQGERRLLHREVAQELEKALAVTDDSRMKAPFPQPGSAATVDQGSQPGYPEEFIPVLAFHFWRGEVWDKAAVYALKAGERARRRFAMREAMASYEQALEALDHQPDAPYETIYQAILGWEEAAFKFRPYEEQLGYLSRAEHLARSHQDRPRLIQALHWSANVYLARGLWTRAGPALTECLVLAEELKDEQLAVRPTYFKGLMMSFSDPDGAREWIERALELARKYDDLTIEALALATDGQVQAQLGEFAQSQQANEAAHQVASRLASPLTESDVDLLAAWACLAMGDIEQSLRLGERGVEIAIATDNMDCICSGLACVGYCNLELGRIPEAAAAFQKGIERSEISGAMIHKLNGQAGLAMAQFSSGRIEAVGDLQEVLGNMLVYQNYVGAANADLMLGMCLSQMGELERAERHIANAVDYYRRHRMRPYLARALFSLAELFEKQGRGAEAQDMRVEAESSLHTLGR